jgi:ribose-phosphate pyrophosphokinase
MRILFYFCLVIASSFAASAQTAVIPLRNIGADLSIYCQSGKCKDSIVETVEADTKEFANGNTFVRFKDSVAQKDVVIIAPAVIDADQFMELLIKVRTAKGEFAKSVSLVVLRSDELRVVDEIGRTLLDPVLVDSLLLESGITKINDKKIQFSWLHRARQAKKTIIVDQGTNSPLAKDLAKELGLQVFNFTNAIKHLQTNPANVVVVSSLASPHNKSFLGALETVYQLKRMGSNVNLVMPYLPYARSDKKDQNGVAVTGRLAADMIERSGTDSISFVRAHAPQSQGFFHIPSLQIMGRKTINAYLSSMGVQQVISPDAGFQKDATLYADELGVPVSVINKQRDLQTGESKLHDMSGPMVAGKTVAIIDDETASGGTLGKAAEFLKAQGATKVIAVVTHLAGNASQAINSSYIDSMAVTDTFEVKVENPKLHVLSIAAELGSEMQKALGLSRSCAKAYRE